MTDFIARAVVDKQGRLLSADAMIDRLNARAGGAMNEVLAVPQLLTVARLARRLGVTVSRNVVAADEDADLSLWVRAEPGDDRVSLTVSGWRKIAGWGEPDAAATIEARSDWRWETDGAMRLTFVAPAPGQADLSALLGQPLTALFALKAGPDGAQPTVDARTFEQQPATVRPTGERVLLSAIGRFDGAGSFAGLTGAAERAQSTEMVDIVSADLTGALDLALRPTLARIVADADSIDARADGPIADGYAEYAANIASAGRHLLGLVDDLGDLQAVEQPGFRLTPEPIDLGEVARRAAALLTVRAAEAGVRLEKRSDQVVALGDSQRCIQIAVNLLGNAMRYAPSGTVVDVAVAEAEGRATLTVSDQGKGIALADQARVFEKFGRVDMDEAGGSGLGLYIARRLARAMGGELTVVSAPGEGARFTLSLPARPSAGA